MDTPNITQQTSTALPVRGELTRDAPLARPSLPLNIGGPLQWLLEGTGWSVLRPLVEFLLLWVAVVLALGGVGATLHVSGDRAPLLALPPLVMLLFYLRGVYRTRLRALILESLLPVISGVSVAAMMVAIIGLYANGPSSPHSTLWLHAWLYALLAVCAARMGLSLAQRWARSRRLVGKPVLIMGAGLVGSQVARRLDSHPEYGLIPVGFLDPDPRSIAEVGGRVMPVLGTVEDLDSAARKTNARHLIVAFSSVADARVSRLVQRCMELGIEVSVVPRMFDTINNRVGYDTVGGLPLMSFTMVDPRGAQFAVKHAIDRVMASVLLVALAPTLLLCALAVRLSSRGPVLFRQRRVGRDGKVFDVYKFRSMYVEPALSDVLKDDAGQDLRADEILGQLGGDTAPGGVEGTDRRTALGRVMRRCSLDELPQLLNVLRGEMSIVGPRPERPEFVELFGQDVTRYSDRHRVKSGITGWAQVHGLRGQTSLDERVEWDNYYIAHWSLGLDLKILALTLVALFRPAE